MNIESSKLLIIQELLKTEEEDVISLIAQILKEKGFPKVTLEDYNRDIDRAEEDIKAGRIIPHEEVVKRLEKW